MKPSISMPLYARLAGVLLAALGLAGAARAAGFGDDCADAAPWRVLQAVPAPPPPARAVMADRGHLLWAGLAPVAGERLLLLQAPQGGLVTVPGQPPQGASGSWPLAPDGAAWPEAWQQRLRHLGEGRRLLLPPEAVAALPQALQGELRVVQLDAQGRVLAAAALQTPGALDDLYAAAEALDDLGAQAAPRRSSWRLWAPTAQAVQLCLYASDHGRPLSRHTLQRDAATGSWWLALKGDAGGRYYRYLVDVWVPGTGLVRQRVTDPYAVSSGADSRRAYVSSLREAAVTPPGWTQDRAPATVRQATDMVVYELHVRDFSRDDASVPSAQRGRYAAFTQGGSQGMRHLRRLASAGLTDVHLLPVFDFGSVPEQGCAVPRPAGAPDGASQQAAIAPLRERDCFNWGYDPVHYSAPEGSYSSRPADGAARLREFRQMVMGLHRAGLRVGMDVVYNHTFSAGQDAKAVLDRIVPGYYHRLDRDGRIERSTCCDNTATEHRMMGKLLLDSVLLWAREHHVDSFRFDLMGHQPRALMERLQQRLRDELPGRVVPLIGEGWNFGEAADGARFVQASQLGLNGSGIGSFNDRLRDAVRGGGAGDSGAALVGRQGWAFGQGYAPNAQPVEGGLEALRRSADLLRVGLAGSLRQVRLQTADGAERTLAQIDYGGGQPAGFASQPAEVVNYVENHDNQTLFDNGVMKLPLDTPAAERARVQLLALATVAFSQGVAYFHAGGELLRSKSLDRNSYNSGDWFNRLDWSGRRNHFGSGLPPAGDNEADWPAMRERLARADIAPTPADIAFTREAFLDLLRIRASTPLLRLADADEVARRLSFANTGPDQVAPVMAWHLDGRGRDDAVFDDLVLLINADVRSHEVVVPQVQGRALRLHPVQAAPGAGDARVREARFESASGRFALPPRTAVVFVGSR